MNITKDTVVTLTFRANDAQGKLLEDGKKKLKAAEAAM